MSQCALFHLNGTAGFLSCLDRSPRTNIKVGIPRHSRVSGCSLLSSSLPSSSLLHFAHRAHLKLSSRLLQSQIHKELTGISQDHPFTRNIYGVFLLVDIDFKNIQNGIFSPLSAALHSSRFKGTSFVIHSSFFKSCSPSRVPARSDLARGFGIHEINLPRLHLALSRGSRIDSVTNDTT